MLFQLNFASVLVTVWVQSVLRSKSSLKGSAPSLHHVCPRQSNSRHQTWQQAPSSTEPYHWPQILVLIRYLNG